MYKSKGFDGSIVSNLSEENATKTVVATSCARLSCQPSEPMLGEPRLTIPVRQQLCYIHEDHSW